MSQKHTPTPWKLTQNGFVRSASGTICDLKPLDGDAKYQERQMNNGAFIVRACNEHAALVAVANQLQTLLNLIDGENEGGDGILEDDLRNAQNALATLSTIQTTLP